MLNQSDVTLHVKYNENKHGENTMRIKTLSVYGLTKKKKKKHKISIDNVADKLKSNKGNIVYRQINDTQLILPIVTAVSTINYTY